MNTITKSDLILTVECIECGYVATAASLLSIEQAVVDFTEDGWRLVNDFPACPNCVQESKNASYSGNRDTYLETEANRP